MASELPRPEDKAMCNEPSWSSKWMAQDYQSPCTPA